MELENPAHFTKMQIKFLLIINMMYLKYFNIITDKYAINFKFGAKITT